MKFDKIALSYILMSYLIIFSLSRRITRTKDDITRNYKTASFIKIFADKLVNGGCNGYVTKEISAANPLIESYTIAKPKDDIPEEFKSKVQKVFLLFGEHPRELVAGQTGFKFLEYICSKAHLSKKDEENLLNIAKFKIILNANPTGRSYLETNKNDSNKVQKRSNARDIDLNRNWPLGFVKFTSREAILKKKLDQDYGGASAFSEPETVAIKDSIDSFKPRVFLTVHSGMEVLMMPYGYKETQVEETNYNNMIGVLNDIKNNHCSKCKVGPLSAVLGYASGGNCLDYAYECLGVPYAFAWEIYAGPSTATTIEQFTPNGLFNINDVTKNWVSAIERMTKSIWKISDDGIRRAPSTEC